MLAMSAAETAPPTPLICGIVLMAFWIIAGLLRPRSTTAVEATVWQAAQTCVNLDWPAIGSAAKAGPARTAAVRATVATIAPGRAMRRGRVMAGASSG